MEADWSQLPSEIIGMVLEKLSFADQLRSRSIRASWNAAARSRSHLPSPQPPWLMIPGDTNASANFFSLLEKRAYRVPLPPPMIRRRLCIGSSFGWLITADDQSDLHLLHPVTGVQVRLPSITTLPSINSIAGPQGRIAKFSLVDDRLKRLTPDQMRCFFFKKAVLSSVPNADGGGDYTVLLIHSPDRRLAFAKAGDEVWTPLTDTNGISDVISSEGRIYAVDSRGDVSVWDDSLSHKEKRVIKGLEHIGVEYYRNYLVMLRGGELLLVLRRVDDVDGKTVFFKVFLLDRASCSWDRVVRLSNFVLFIGNNHSMYLETTDLPEMTPNCVYFTDDDLKTSSHHRHQQRDAGVYNMTDFKITSLGSLCSHLNWPPPIWVTPTLF